VPSVHEGRGNGGAAAQTDDALRRIAAGEHDDVERCIELVEGHPLVLLDIARKREPGLRGVAF
jgi:hypothetical protein